MSDIAKRLRASVKMDAINGDRMERSVCGRQMLDAAAHIECLECKLAAMTEAYENMRAFARAHGLDTTASANESNRRSSES